MTFELMNNRQLNREGAIRDQMIRASLSVMNNIAEGHGRISKKENMRFLDIAIASCIEVESMTYLLRDLNMIDSENLELYQTQVLKTKKLTKGYIRYLRNRSS